MSPRIRAALAVIAAAGITSATYQRIADARDRRRFPPPGHLAGIGGRRIHLLAAGHGTPAVVIIPALGDSALGWLRVQRALAGIARTVTYEAAGRGWSDPPRGRVTPDAMAGDLHAALTAAGIPPPYVIAGHSLGGIVARRFQARYPGDVAGILLADSSHEGQARRLPWRAGAGSNLKRAVMRQARVLGVRRLAASFGLVAAVSPASLARETVPEYMGAERAITLSTRQRRTAVRELLMAARLRGCPQDLGSLLVTVLSSANRRWSGWPAWSQLQDELAALSTETVQMNAVNAGHYVHLDQPGLVVQEISSLVSRCRAAGPGGLQSHHAVPISTVFQSRRMPRSGSR